MMIRPTDDRPEVIRVPDDLAAHKLADLNGRTGPRLPREAALRRPRNRPLAHKILWGGLPKLIEPNTTACRLFNDEEFKAAGDGNDVETDNEEPARLFRGDSLKDYVSACTRRLHRFEPGDLEKRTSGIQFILDAFETRYTDWYEEARDDPRTVNSALEWPDSFEVIDGLGERGGVKVTEGRDANQGGLDILVFDAKSRTLLRLSWSSQYDPSCTGARIPRIVQRERFIEIARKMVARL